MSIARMCSIHIVGYLQRLETRTEVYVVYRAEAWVFMSGADAQRDVLNIRAIREGRALRVGTSQAVAAAAVSAGKRDRNLEQENPDAQARVRECPRGISRVRQAEEISSAVIQRQLSSERVVQDC